MPALQPRARDICNASAHSAAEEVIFVAVLRAVGLAISPKTVARETTQGRLFGADDAPVTNEPSQH